ASLPWTRPALRIRTGRTPHRCAAAAVPTGAARPFHLCRGDWPRPAQPASSCLRTPRPSHAGAATMNLPPAGRPPAPTHRAPTATPGGGWMRSLGSHLVAGTANIANGFGAELAAQVMQVNLYGVAAHLLTPAVHRILELHAREHGAGTLHQGLQQCELASRQLDFFAIAANLAPYRVEGEAAAFQQRRGPAGVAAQQGAHPRHQFVKIEWLEHIVVRAGVQAIDAVGNCITRGDDQHRQQVAPRAQLAQELHAVLARKPEIEYRQVVHAVG